MSTGADVRFVPALRDWHATMTAYRTDLMDALVGIEQEIRRAHDWLTEQLGLWRRALRDCEEDVIRCKAELSARKFPNWDGKMPDTTVQEENLRIAVARHRHADDQIDRIRRWMTKLPKVVEENYSPAAHRLGALLDGELPRGLALLERRATALETYAGLRADFAAGGSAAPPQPPAAPPEPKPEPPQ